MSAGSQHPATIAVSAGRPHGIGEPLNHPITLASNFRGEEGVYSRTHGTPGWIGLEEAVGALEGGRAVSFSSGMAAAAAAVFALAPKVLVLPTYSYLGVRALVDDHVRQGHLQVRFVDIADTAAVVAAIAGADVVWVETPTNPTLDVADIPAICAAAAAAGAKVVVDSTFATPVCARPLADGATIVIHSGTKFIGGHSDLLIGLAVAADDATYERLRQTRLVNGSTPGALEAFLALRGVRTLPLRMERMQANAVEVVARLRTHSAVADVRYPGFGAMVAFVLAGGADAADAACRAVRLIVPATSLGGVESSMERRQKYAGDAHVPPGLIRMSVGIEHVDDIWADLAQALAAG
ncbi:MAG: aminotransferase class I/II-fold pyridoxal phosphate-dependent enzyme [Ilumatobacteraceae bacterium]|nr:aminotransferase class I/II-fold pyridoxal phosphate-dependent enzyme [Ilumatobacteraceae bacterium]MBP7889033.1 aminotransferase class I/II-fold pyridoxal phosphate-dependent enzyme [Ilumatobacteraceae bacterium]MBP8209385.1 aminotransferase class I/II-fold pyridoxal phosphate-dependent enzyme [Ilumatobacteraceae bacterium]